MTNYIKSKQVKRNNKKVTRIIVKMTHLLVLSFGKMYEISAPAKLSIVAFGTYI